MQFEVNSNQVKTSLDKLNSIIVSNPVQPILGAIHVKAEKNKLRMTSTDMDITIIEALDADVKKEGEIAIPIKLFSDLVKQLPNVMLQCTVEDKFRLRIKCSLGSYSIGCYDAADYPMHKHNVDSKSMVIDTKLLLSVIKKTSFAISEDELRLSLTGLYANITNENSCFVSTDGHRLVKINRNDFSHDTPCDFIIPAKLLSVLSKVLLYEKTKLMIKEGSISIINGETSIMGQLLRENFPDYESVIPKNNTKKLIVEKDDFVNMVRRVAIFSDTGKIALEILKNKLTVKSFNDESDDNQAEEIIDCKYDDEDISIGFNAQYIIDVFSHVDSKEVCLALSSSNSAGIVTPVDDSENEKVMMLIMPILLND